MTAPLLPPRPAGLPPVDAAVILGSGLGDFVSYLEDAVEYPYHTLAGFPEVTVEGHSGALYTGRLKNRFVMVFSGRFHFYEGHPLARTVLPVQLASAWGARRLVVSNAAGGLAPEFYPGDLMMITGWIRPMGPSVSGRPGLRGQPVAGDPLLLETAAGLGQKLYTGTYCYLTGPTYETPAEIRAIRFMGADAVGMSTVPELEEAARLHLPVTAVSLITNKAAGMGDAKLDHHDVKVAAASAKDRFGALISAYIARI